MPPTPRVTILMATRNGAAHLAAQLASLEAQDHAAWDLWVSDDGSTDETRKIVANFSEAQAGRRTVRLVDGPRLGTAAANFLHLMCHPDLPTDRPAALSDQDDVWLADKLSRGLTALERGGPLSLYGARAILTDRDLRQIGSTRQIPAPPSFANALTQNIVPGYTAILSPAALDLVRRAGPLPDVPHHDWWLYLLVSGAGGEVIHDPATVALYRQHHTNAMGAPNGLRASVNRARRALSGEYAGWVEANRRALGTVAHLLTPENRTLLEALNGIEARNGAARLKALRALGLRRQSKLSDVAFGLAALLGRV
ncbi:glycosyltransferase [Jannaschia aquimarina]|uniref:WfgD protein n=1 Tax=Jannaschia aquimarina TaxID=935700 RepID=A0A0D1ED17_9RHOB|nr:glycosyltransferase [Jannaschia aquimarina]KIT15619.1 UDP-Glc:alpha-D-GlcNAc-diphosphoundecaprenol beta-1,3-glucosyltransferase WfgD [Jannaschia aquimarina]SNT27811.1 Glycosyl transferase family 2 [Jannaschia aquimarina]